MNRHGEMKFSWDKNLLTVHTKGQFNLEGFKYGFSQLQNTVLNNPYDTWQRLQVLDDETMASPEVIEYGKATWAWCFDNGCTHFAFVVANALQMHILNNSASSKVKAFTTIEEAKKWLNEVG